MKKKTCHWLNSKKRGAIMFRQGRVEACCTRNVILVNKTESFLSLTSEQLLKRRSELHELINNSHTICEGCGCLYETDEKNIELGKYEVVLYHTHAT